MTFLALICEVLPSALSSIGVNSVLRRAGQLAVAFQGLDFVLAHQEVESLGVLGNDLRFAVLHRAPVQLGRIHAFDAEFLGVFQVIPELGVEQQRLGRNAADVQAGAAEVRVFLDQGSLQAVLAGADGGSVSGRAAADDGYVVNGVRQRRAPLVMDETEQTNDSNSGRECTGSSQLCRVNFKSSHGFTRISTDQSKKLAEDFSFVRF